MAVNRFVLNGMSFHGHGAINGIPGIVASKGFKKAFVASDPDLVKFGVTAKITDLLCRPGTVMIFTIARGLLHIGTGQRFQNVGMAAFAVIIVEIKHKFLSSYCIVCYLLYTLPISLSRMHIFLRQTISCSESTATEG